MKLNRIHANPAILVVVGIAIVGYLLAVGQVFKSVPAPGVSFVASGAIIHSDGSFEEPPNRAVEAYWRRIKDIKLTGKKPSRDPSLMIQ